MKKLVLLIVLGSITLSCQKAKENTIEGSALDDSAFEDEQKAFFNALLEPAEVATQLQATNAEFNPGLLNDLDTYEVYIGTEIKAAANLGIYLSDLNYCIAYGKRDFSKEYFTAAHELSKALGIDRAVLDFLLKRYQDNLERNDSVKTVVKDLWVKSVRSFQDTEREKLAGVAMAAYEIENLYLILEILKSYPMDKLTDGARITALGPLYKRMLSQRSNMVIIYNFIRAYSDPLDPDKNPNYLYYDNALKELITVYKKMGVEEKIANNREVELMNDAVVNELSEKVNAIRTKIVSVE